MNEQRWWWLAINGATCAASNFPIEVKKLNVKPVPELVIGYESREEQLRRQTFFLEAPVDECRAYFQRELLPLLAARQVVVQELPNPEPPTDGATIWTNFPIEGEL